MDYFPAEQSKVFVARIVFYFLYQGINNCIIAFNTLQENSVAKNQHASQAKTRVVLVALLQQAEQGRGREFIAFSADVCRTDHDVLRKTGNEWGVTLN